MKEALGGVSLFQIVILFLLIFTGVMCLTINHSKAFGVKDEIINILETTNANSHELSTNTVNEIINHLNEVGYRITGNCPDGWTGYNRNGTKVSKNASFCIKAFDVSKAYQNNVAEICKRNGCNTTSGGYPEMIYYDIVLFYQLDIPILNEVMNFKLKGSTKIIFG